jgi:DNA-directed RNA polymerase subunit M
VVINMFCPKCGSILRPMKADGKKVLGCSCGYTDQKKEILSESVKKKKEIEVIDKDEDDMLPTTEIECPECGHNEGWYWLVQTRAADEPETKFLKCTKCKHTFRVND